MKLMILTVMMFLGQSTFGAAATLVSTVAGTPGTEEHLDGQRDQAQFSRPTALLQLNAPFP